MVKAVILIKAVPTKLDAILKVLHNQTDEVYKAYLTFGRADIAAFVRGFDVKEIADLSSEINSIDGVRSTETLVES